MSPTADLRRNTRVIELPVVPKPRPGMAMGTMGLLIFLLSLTMLFLASIVGYLVIRFRAETWPPPGLPPLPAGLWISTAVLLVSSVTIQRALNHVRNNRPAALKRDLLITSGLGFAFLALQSFNWWKLLSFPMQPNLYVFTFLMLTGLHAVHVIGGLIPLGCTTFKAFHEAYSPQRHQGVLHCVLYWHFLDGIWMVLFLLLMLFS